MMNQNLMLEVSGVSLLTGQGTDQLIIHVPAADEINRATEGVMRDGAVFGHSLHFSLTITKGCGERLANELGLLITKRVEA